MDFSPATRMSYRLTAGSTRDLPDVEAFLATLHQLAAHPLSDVRDLFDPAATSSSAVRPAVSM